MEQSPSPVHPDVTKSNEYSQHSVDNLLLFACRDTGSCLASPYPNFSWQESLLALSALQGHIRAHLVCGLGVEVFLESLNPIISILFLSSLLLCLHYPTLLFRL
jgi:hypothetical protein